MHKEARRPQRSESWGNPPADADSLYQAAVRALARRARSSGELRALLARRKGSKAGIEAVLHRLKQHGYLD